MDWFSDFFLPHYLGTILLLSSDRYYFHFESSVANDATIPSSPRIVVACGLMAMQLAHLVMLQIPRCVEI